MHPSQTPHHKELSKEARPDPKDLDQLWISLTRQGIRIEREELLMVAAALTRDRTDPAA